MLEALLVARVLERLVRLGVPQQRNAAERHPLRVLIEIARHDGRQLVEGLGDDRDGVQASGVRDGPLALLLGRELDSRATAGRLPV